MESPPQLRRIPRDRHRNRLIEGEEADRSVRLNVIHLVDTAVKAKLDLVRAVNLVERGRELSSVLAQPVIAIRIGANIGIAGAGDTG